MFASLWGKQGWGGGGGQPQGSATISGIMSLIQTHTQLLGSTLTDGRLPTLPLPPPLCLPFPHEELSGCYRAQWEQGKLNLGTQGASVPTRSPPTAAWQQLACLPSSLFPLLPSV